MSDERHPDARTDRPADAASKLPELRAREARLDALRDRRADLEVERIVAAVELGAGRAAIGSEVSGASAAAVVDALDRLRGLESRHAARLAFVNAGVRSREALLERLRAGDEALRAWLHADREDAGGGGRRVAKRVLMLLCLAVVGLAVAVHVAFLVLLVPVGGAMSFLLWTGQDRAWRRMGAKRRFESLRLETPDPWTESTVRERRRALSRVAEEVRRRMSAAGDDDAFDDDGGADEAHRLAELEAARSDLSQALARAGLSGDGVDESSEARLRALARAFRAEQALKGVTEDMASERADAGELRESIYRELARDGEAPPGGDASVGALETGLKRGDRR